MSLFAVIVIAWCALSIPFAIFIGKGIRQGQPTCMFTGCDEPAEVQGLCAHHDKQAQNAAIDYLRLRRQHGAI